MERNLKKEKKELYKQLAIKKREIKTIEIKIRLLKKLLK